MTFARPSAIEKIAVQMPCEYCGADPNDWCETKSGGRYNYLHSDREWAVRTGWSLGSDYGWSLAANISCKTLLERLITDTTFVRTIMQAMNDPGSFVKRGADHDGNEYGEYLTDWQRRALKVALQEHGKALVGRP